MIGVALQQRAASYDIKGSAKDRFGGYHIVVPSTWRLSPSAAEQATFVSKDGMKISIMRGLFPRIPGEVGQPLSEARKAKPENVHDIRIAGYAGAIAVQSRKSTSASRASTMMIELRGKGEIVFGHVEKHTPFSKEDVDEVEAALKTIKPVRK